MALLEEHLTTPACIDAVEIHGAKHTRRSLLDRVVKPLVDPKLNVGTTLGEVLARVQQTASKLDRYGTDPTKTLARSLLPVRSPPPSTDKNGLQDVFQPGTQVSLSNADQVDPANPAASASDIKVAFKVKEKPRHSLQVGTVVGDSEGFAHTTATLRNIFGGAETLSVNASKGTRTRSACNALFSVPVKASPDTRLGLEAVQSATQKPWASHEELLNGGSLRLGWLSQGGSSHAVHYTGVWRQVTGLAAGASASVRADAGDSVKSSITHTFTRDRRDSPSLPQRGYLVRTVTELAGWGPLRGDVSFCKSQVELGGALPVVNPWLRGLSVGGGFRMGMLYPLPSGYSVTGKAQASRINDRFRLGGPTDVRGFDMGGLGPHDGGDAVGGDVYAAGGVNMLFPLPRSGADSPLRLQIYVNGGRLVALRREEKEGAGASTAMDSCTVSRGMKSALRELATGLPSMTAGVGLVYVHPIARVELNFSLPLVVRRMEESRKGVQFGFGIDFL